jgi:hypothetical protein
MKYLFFGEDNVCGFSAGTLDTISAVETIFCDTRDRTSRSVNYEHSRMS